MPQPREHFHRLLLIVLISVLLQPAKNVFAETVEDIQQLAQTGAVNLALLALDKTQAQTGIKPDDWQSLERERITLYRERHAWRKIASRLLSLPNFVTSTFHQWAGMQRAQALIDSGEAAIARAQLRQLIWSNHSLSDIQLSDWRRLVIRSYLAQGLAGDAQTAMMRYQQDYPQQAEQEYLLRARILLLNKNDNEAIELLKAHSSDPTAGALILLAQLRGQTRPAKKVLEATLRHLRAKDNDAAMTANLWAVAAEAAQRAQSQGSAVMALEAFMLRRKSVSLPKSIIDFGTDDLWNAYLQNALAISNKRQLLIGEDKTWLTLADKLKKTKPIAARSLYAFIILRGHDADIRGQSAQSFMQIISALKQGAVLLQDLFEKSRYFTQRKDIPAVIRPRLVDLALADGNIDLASEIMATIKKPPPGEDQFMWYLRRARILVLGNQLKLGEQALTAILASKPTLEQLQVDRFMQVIFDIQTAGDNDAACDLFTRLMTHTDNQKTRREIYYWMADSRKAQKHYAEAAQLYLKSAMYPDPTSMDPWAQTAHYQAAVVLAKAGLYQDAQTLLQHLLKVTKDPERRAALQRELQKTWAMQ